MRKKISLYLVLKILYFLQKAAARDVHIVQRVFGFEGVVSLLQLLETEDALKLLRSVNAKVGERVRISKGLTLNNINGTASNLTIGDNCHLGPDILIDLVAPLKIGNRVTISMRCMLLTHMDPGDSGCEIQRRVGEICIEDDAYVGAGAIILPGVTIGARAVVGAGAVVTKNISPGSIVAGVPARRIRTT